MRRGYTSGEFAALVRKLRRMWPEVAIGADVIVGFPGETQEQKEENFLKALDVLIRLAMCDVSVGGVKPHDVLRELLLKPEIMQFTAMHLLDMAPMKGVEDHGQALIREHFPAIAVAVANLPTKNKYELFAEMLGSDNIEAARAALRSVVYLEQIPKEFGQVILAAKENHGLWQEAKDLMDAVRLRKQLKANDGSQFEAVVGLAMLYKEGYGELEPMLLQIGSQIADAVVEGKITDQVTHDMASRAISAICYAGVKIPNVEFNIDEEG
jgi:hypothetical protein